MVQRSLYLCASYGIYGHKGPSFLQVALSEFNGSQHPLDGATAKNKGTSASNFRILRDS